jgi:hypothetical protein
VFRGYLETPSGQREPVEHVAAVRRVDRGTLRWTEFGPFTNPLSVTGRSVGLFVGTVGARVVAKDGSVTEDPSPAPISFEVTPSIVVHELQPLTASCAGGVLRALGGAPYRLRVETVGFVARTLTYNLSFPGLDLRPIALRRLPSGALDEVGARGDLRLPEVPDGLPSYAALLTIEAREASGALVQSAFGLTVHRPLEVFYNGNLEVAEVLAPTPVSGCIPGGINGREVEYSESQSESRSRSYDLSWDESWVQSHTVASGTDTTVGLSESNGVGFATTDGQSFRWSLGTEISGELGLDKLVTLGMSASAEVGGERSRSTEQSQSRETGVNASSTTTETEELSRGQSGSNGGSFSWSVSSEQQIGRSFSGTVIAGTFGVFYRQTMRLVRRAALVAYNQCGQASVVGDVDFTDWTWSPDLALGNSCPPLPASNLPAAACYVPPCAGGE